MKTQTGPTPRRIVVEPEHAEAEDRRVRAIRMAEDEAVAMLDYEGRLWLSHVVRLQEYQGRDGSLVSAAKLLLGPSRAGAIHQAQQLFGRHPR